MAKNNGTLITGTFLWLTLFAIAMAHTEAALVVHLRSLYYPENPVTIFPLQILSQRDLGIELVREAATLIMILSVAALAERGYVRVFAAFLYVFGWWDLAYYAWLKQMIGWPTDWLEWDVLFLIPWPWFGPWLTAALIALLFVVWGGWVMTTSRERFFTRISLLFLGFGIMLALAAFLLPALPLLSGGQEALHGFIPTDFSWIAYTLGYASMLVGLVLIARSGRE